MKARTLNMILNGEFNFSKFRAWYLALAQAFTCEKRGGISPMMTKKLQKIILDHTQGRMDDSSTER